LQTTYVQHSNRRPVIPTFGPIYSLTRCLYTSHKSAIGRYEHIETLFINDINQSTHSNVPSEINGLPNDLQNAESNGIRLPCCDCSMADLNSFFDRMVMPIAGYETKKKNRFEGFNTMQWIFLM
jgi:hypothetical protein